MIQLGGADRTSIRFLRSWPGGLLYAPGAPDLTEEKIIEHFIDGSSVFHDGNELERYYFMRVRNYVHIENLVAAEIWHAAVDGECHGGHFVNVADASSWLKWFKTLSPEKYATKVFGKDFGFPPYGIGCYCGMSGLVEGVQDYHRLNSERKLWTWLRRITGKR